MGECNGIDGFGIDNSTRKSFDIPSPNPAKKDTHRLRHFSVEGDQVGGGLLYRRQITALKAGVTDLIFPDWFAYIAKNVMVFVNGVKHMGSGWGEQDSLDPCVVHITTSRGGKFNVLVTADRADDWAETKCPRDIEYEPQAASTTQSLPTKK